MEKHKVGEVVRQNSDNSEWAILEVGENNYRVLSLKTGKKKRIAFHAVHKERDAAYVVRTHGDSWASVRMRNYMFLLCIGASGAMNTDASVLVVDMETQKIVVESDEILQMVMESSEASDEVTDDEMMYEFARNEYI